MTELMTKETVNVLCMKWGKAYSPAYVNVLHSAVRQRLARPHRFICLTDDPSGLAEGIETCPIPDMGLPLERLTRGAWPKIAVFKPGLRDMRGPVLFLDLDIVILDALDPFFDTAPDGLHIIREWGKHRRGGNSSVFLFQAGAQTHIYERFAGNPAAALENVVNDQDFVSAHAQGLQFWPAAWCRSFKRHCLRPFPLNLLLMAKKPAGARIICFHGRPNPDEVIVDGWWGRGRRRGHGPVKWVLDYWRASAGG